MSVLKPRLEKLSGKIDEAMSTLTGEIDSTEGELSAFGPDIIAPLLGFGTEVKAKKDDIKSQIESLVAEIQELVAVEE